MDYQAFEATKKDIFQIVNCLAVFVGCRFMDLVPRNMRFARGFRLDEPSESDPAPVHATKPQETDETEIQGTIDEDEASTLTKVNSKLGMLFGVFLCRNERIRARLESCSLCWGVVTNDDVA
jgi:hypothetical protein